MQSHTRLGKAIAKRICSGGGKGMRTPDLLHAKQLLSQLSYAPTFEAVSIIPLLKREDMNSQKV